MTKLTYSVTELDLVGAFTEWEEQYRKNPRGFMSHAESLLTETPRQYGEATADYFIRLLQGDTQKRRSFFR